MTGPSRIRPRSVSRFFLALITSLLGTACDDGVLSGPVAGPNMSHVSFDCSAQTSISAAECEALVVLYNSTDGDNWTTRTGWLANNTPCAWFGVQCFFGSSITSISLCSNALTGSIPARLATLPNLNLLSLCSNQLSGPIPPELGSAVSLRFLVLHANQLTGTIPAELGNLSNLVTLSLTSNRLTGSVPAALGNLTEMVGNLALGGNQLTGAIPSELGRLSKLRNFSLNDNQLSGPIPPQLGNMVFLNSLDLSNNQLTGSIPPELGSPPLGSLRLYGNQLSGLVPWAVAARGGAMPICLFRHGNLDLFIPDVASYRNLDVDGNGRICDVPFTAVAAAAPLIADELTSVIETLYDSGVVNDGQATALIDKINQALRQFGRKKYAGAIGVLEGFLRQVRDLAADGVLTPPQAESLIFRVQVMMEVIAAAG